MQRQVLYDRQMGYHCSCYTDLRNLKKIWSAKQAKCKEVLFEMCDYPYIFTLFFFFTEALLAVPEVPVSIIRLL